MSGESDRSLTGVPALPGRWRRLFALVSVVLLMAGCGTTSNVIIDEEIVTNQKPMASYTSLVLRDFELKRELYDDGGDSPGERERFYKEMPARLSEQILRYVKARRVYETVSRGTDVSAATLILQGTFIRVGRFRITIEAVLMDGGTGQEVAYFRQTLWDVLDTSEAIGRLGREVADFLDRIQYK